MNVDGYDIIYTDNKYTVVTIVYRWSTELINGNIIDPSDTSKFTKDASTLGKSYYLKHVLNKDNQVIESYACAISKGKEYCLTYGEYEYSRDKNSYKGNALILKKLRDAKIEGISCILNAYTSYCRDGSIELYANLYGYVKANDGVGYCHVEYGGNSRCFSS